MVMEKYLKNKSKKMMERKKGRKTPGPSNVEWFLVGKSQVLPFSC